MKLQVDGIYSNASNTGYSSYVFGNNEYIKNVDLNNIPFYYNKMADTFYRSTNLETVSNINQNVNYMVNAFEKCSNLKKVPNYPDTVTHMTRCFTDCSSLEDVPKMPTSAITLSRYISYCPQLFDKFLALFPDEPTLDDFPTNLSFFGGMFAGLNLTATKVPEKCLKILKALPEKAKTDWSGVFSGWHSLETAPEIPDYVEDIDNIFYGCSKLTGDIIIRSEKITKSGGLTPFTGVLKKDVYIPYYDENGEYTTTYKTFTDEWGYDEEGTKHGVYLHDLATYTTNVSLTINPTPSDSTVTFSTGEVSGNTCTVVSGTSVTYTVSKTGYISETNTIVVDADTNIDVSIKLISYAWSLLYNSSKIGTVYTTTSTPTAGDQLYDGNGNQITNLYNNTVNETGSSLFYNWKDENLGEHRWQCIAYGNNVYVAISMDGYVSTSSDGTHWNTAVALPTGLQATYYALAFGNGFFLALSYNTSVVIKSYDGINWEKLSGTPHSSTSTANTWQRLAFGNGVFVAMSSTGYISSTTDGNTWTTATDKLSNHYWFCLGYFGNKFVAIGSRSALTSIWTATSTDGVSWSSVSEVASVGSTIYYWLDYTSNTYRYNAFDGQGRRITSTSAGSTTSWSSPTSTIIGNQYWRYGLNGIYIGYYGYSGIALMTGKNHITVQYTESDSIQYVRDTSKDIT